MLTAWVLVIAWVVTAAAAGSNEPKTVFDHAQSAWAVGTVSLGTPLAFRDGRVLAFPAQIDDLLWAKKGSPRNLMLVYEVPAAEIDKPFYKAQDVLFAPIQLLPEHSFWRDNLPETPRHGVAGGRRNVFRGDEIPEAKRVLGAFLHAGEIQGKARWGVQLEAVAQALSSSVPRLIEDAVTYLSASPRLASDFPDSARDPISRFLEGPRPDAEKTQLVDALGRAKAAAMGEELRKLAAGAGPVAAAAMVALDQMGTGASLERLLELSKSPSDEVRAYAAGRLAADRTTENGAFERALSLLDPAQPAVVQAAVIQGLGWSGNQRAVEPLRTVLMKGEPMAKPAADALARIGGEDAGKALQQALTSGAPAAAAAAVDVLRRVEGCADCARVLVEQHTKHPDKTIRDLIGIVLELPRPHHQ
ncbi:MAG: HEAT repeat domain-containing protein [Deltaproteobacteria bacterium]|nr:HEAT repeat domain-containing protein [Deltaproteobacteria bacterium]